ncbi:hypothetical protein AC579_174 [Pseudocercospora musae]|uniref:Uncharacterized protein n=1 Tax=Pseudocercospora musae TaxID=113226 RepID=A0A139I0S4_9PEZI|nr:hypothetical protein AC579_174 [Pseudocercospora musae]
MASTGVASRSARSFEQRIDRKLEKAYQGYCAIRDALEEMQLGPAVLGPRVEEPKRRCGRAGPWRTKTLAELEEEIGVMTRLGAAVLFGWNSRQNVLQRQSQQQHPYPPPAARAEHPTPPSLAGTTPIGTLETDDAAAVAASLHRLHQLGRHHQYHDQQEQHGYPLGAVESQPKGAGPALAIPFVPYEFGKDPTQFQDQEQQQYGEVAQLSGGHHMPIDAVQQPTADPSSSGNVEQALPTPMPYQQPDMGLGDGTQQNAGDGVNEDLWDSSDSQDQERADDFLEQELLNWAQMLGVDLSMAPDQGQEGASEAM